MLLVCLILGESLKGEVLVLQGGDKLENQAKKRWISPQLTDLTIGITEFDWHAKGKDGAWTAIPVDVIPVDVIGSGSYLG